MPSNARHSRPLGPGFLFKQVSDDCRLGAGTQQSKETRRSGAAMKLRDRAEYLPTRRQIRAACEAIRRQWTAAERRRRAVGDGMPASSTIWFPPHISTAHCMARVRRMAAEASA